MRSTMLSVNIEGVLRIPGGVVLGNVQQLEVVVVQLHLGAFHHVKAHAREAVHHLVHAQGDGMGAAAGGQGAGLGHVDGLPAQGRFLLDGLELPLLFVQQGGEFLPGLVNQLARLGALLGGELAHAPQ